MNWEELQYQMQLRWQWYKSRHSGTCEHFVPKIAFLFHNSTPLDHFLPVVRHLDPASFEFVCMHGCPDQDVIGEEAKRLGVACRKGEDIMRTKTMYAVAVANHYVHVFNNRFILKDIAFTNVRMVYGLGKKGWHMSYWNRIFDHILCFGPYQVREFDRLLGVSASGIGYARYDTYFSGELDRDALLRELGCDPDKPTVAWLPTHGVYSSINRWCEHVSALSEHYNIVVRPHILTTKNDPKRVEILRRGTFNALLDQHYNNTKLFTVADFVLADYGGTCFSSLYCDKNLLMLNVPETKLGTDLGADSEEFHLRKHILSIDEDKGSALAEILGATQIWKDQSVARVALRDHFFTPNYGFAGKMGANDLVSRLEDSISRNSPKP